MIRIGILGDIGSGKSYVAKNFGYPVFNADYEVAKLYRQNKNVFNMCVTICVNMKKEQIGIIYVHIANFSAAPLVERKSHCGKS